MTDDVSRTMAETTRTLERMWRRRDRRGRSIFDDLRAILQLIYDDASGGVPGSALPGGSVTDHVAAADPHAGYVKESEFNAKGDLLVGTANDTLAALTVGSNGQIPYADSTQTTGIRWGAPPSSGGETQGTYLVSGGQVTWVTGLQFDVSAGTGYINGVLYSWAGQAVTLDAADPTDPRIDVIYVDATGTADSITGTAAADPSEPVVDPGTQLKLSLVTVGAGATEPTVTSELLYAENAGSPTEWDWTTSGSGWTLASTSNPRGGTTDVEGTSVAANAYVQGERGSGTIDPTAYQQLVLYLRFKSAWGNNRFLQVTLRNGGVQVGNALRISNGFFGLDSSNTSTYQAVIIPTLQFATAPGALIDQVRIQALGSGGTAIGCYLDDISFTSGGTIVVGGDGISQDQADARYLRRANNLSDVESAATARTNLGIVQGHAIEDEGSAVTQRGTLNFTGDGVAVADTGGKTTVTVSTASHDHTASAGDGGVLTNDEHDGYSEYAEIEADPSTPSGNKLRIYAKDKDGVSTLYYITDDGTVYELPTLGSGGAGSGAPVDAHYITTQSEIGLTNEVLLSAVNGYGLLADRPAAGTEGRFYYASDSATLFRDDGAGWDALSTGADELAKVSSNDTTAGYLNGKLVAGTGVTLTENDDGADETLTISTSLSGSGLGYRAWVYSDFSTGEFTYVVDDNGDPIYALMELE